MRFVIAFICGLAAVPVHAATLLCLGTYPGFMMTATSTQATFDYLGDGRFGIEPAIQAPGFGYATHSLVTARERWPIYFTEERCEVIGVTLPVSVEVAVPTSAGVRPLQGCCRWHALGDE